MDNVIYKCSYCNKEFKPSNYQIKQAQLGKKVFCSSGCGTSFRYNKVKTVDNQLLDKLKHLINNTDLSYEEIRKQCNMTNELFKTTLDKYNLRRSEEQINKLKIQKMKETIKDRYGVENVMEIKEFRDNISESHAKRTKEQKEEAVLKQKATKLKVYGDETYHNIDKAKQTMLDKYGYDYGCNSETAIKHRVETSIKRYGVDNPLKLKEIRDKGTSIIKNKYNVKKSSLESPEVREKAKQTLLSRYGVDNIMKLEKYKKKHQNTMFSKYNVIAGFLTENGINSHKQGTKSKINKKFVEMIQQITNKTIKQEKSIIKYIYDIQIGDDLLIDINPTISHNVYMSYPYLIGASKENKPVSINYHLNRTLLANEHNFKLISVFDWDDWEKIKYLIQDKETLYARKLHIKEVSKKDTDDFLNKYHLQNTCRGQEIRLGLYNDEDILIEVMTFGQPRYNKNYEWELLRLCTKSEYKVVGGAEKLFNAFKYSYEPKSIISYCDYSKFNGDVYTKLGFNIVRKPVPAKHWCKEDVQITDNLLRQRGYDQLFNTNYGKGTDNEELMILNGWLPIYDCGQISFSWNQD